MPQYLMYDILTAPQAGSEPIEATFELNDTLYAKAHIPPTEEVYLWLGVSKVTE